MKFKTLLISTAIAAVSLLSSGANAATAVGAQLPTSVSWNDPSKFNLVLAPAASATQFALRGDGLFASGADLLPAILGATGQSFVNNSSTATQTPTAATRTYIAGSQLTIPATGLKVGTVLRWHFDLTKTAAGSATSTIDIAFGTTGTTTDTARVSFTKPAGTAAIDEGWIDIECIIQLVNATNGVAVGEFRLVHNLSATGHAQIPCVVVNTISSTFNSVSPTSVGLCITTGASDVITINQCSAEAVNM